MRYIMIGTIAALMCFYAYSDGDQNQQREDIQLNIDQQPDENYQNDNMEGVVSLGEQEVKMVVEGNQKEQVKSVNDQTMNRLQEGKVAQGIIVDDKISAQKDVVNNKFKTKPQKLGKQYNKSNVASSIPRWRNPRSSSQLTNTPKQQEQPQKSRTKTPKHQSNQPKQYQKQPHQKQSHKKAPIYQNPTATPTSNTNTNTNVNANANTNTNTNANANTNTNRKNSKIKEQRQISQTKSNNRVVVTV